MIDAIHTLLAPRSVAVVGASVSESATALKVLASLRLVGYAGRVYPVNPRYEQVAELPCYPSLAAIPGDLDAAFIGLPAAKAVDVVEEAGRRGVRAVIVNASGFAEAGPDGAALQTRLAQTAGRYGMAVCGPNNMGLVNWLDRAAFWTGTLVPPERTGPVGVISQSGSISIAFAADDRGIGLGMIVSSGNEAVLTSAEYLHHFVQDDRIHLVLHFAETLKDPQAYAAAAGEARDRGKPIIVLKVGRTARGQRATLAHTGSLAGDDREFDAFCRRYGLIRAATLDEMLETAELFSKASRPPRRDGACIVTMSGGEAALLSDLAADADVPIAELSAPTRAALAELYPPYTAIGNPFDAWGARWDPDAYRAAVQVVAADPQVGVIACAVDPAARSTADRTTALHMARIHLDALNRSADDSPGAVFFNNVSAGLSPAMRRLLEGTGIAYLQGCDRALRALGHWIRYHRAPRPRPGAEAPSATRPPDPLAAVLDDRSGAVLNEYLSVQLLRAYGIPVVRSLLARTPDEAVGHAAAIGFPVVLKVVSAQLPHKSDVGGVVLDLRTSKQVRAAFDTVTARVRGAHPELHLDGVLIQPMVSGGLEMYLGASIGVYGPCILVAPGGIHVEQTGDVVTALAPVDADEAREMLGRLRGGVLLDARRGQPARDVAALVAMMCNLSRLAIECGPWLAAVDINPVVVLAEGDGVYALDALVELRR